MSDGRRPLEGIRVLELASIVAGPFCGALMAEFGAEVIKTELPGKGDDLRRLGPSEGDCTYWWSVDNRNKKVMTLDLHHPRAQDIVRQLVPLCDVVIENFRPGVLERWHLGWDDLSRQIGMMLTQPLGDGARDGLRTDRAAAPGSRLRRHWFRLWWDVVSQRLC